MNHEQGSPEWHKQRKGRFTSSQVYRLMTEPKTKAQREAGELSEGAKTYVFEKALEVAYGLDFSFAGNEATEWGNDCEAEAVKCYEDTFLTTVERTHFIAYGDHGGGSPDGIEGKDTIIEIKTPFNERNFFEAVYKDEYPKQYYWQVQDLMRITGCTKANLVYFNFNLGKCYCIPIERNEEGIARIAQKIEQAAKLKADIIETLNNKLG